MNNSTDRVEAIPLSTTETNSPEDMRTPTLKDINALGQLITDPFQNDIADKVGKILEGIVTSAYDEAYAIWEDRFEKPVIKTGPDGKCAIYVNIKDIRTGKDKGQTDFESMPDQAKFDMISSIWNMLRFNTEEIENL